jgi:protein gp37
MATHSKIEWTQTTWNPVTGCSKVSPGCINCYAERLARRLQAMGQPNYAKGFEVTIHHHMLERPLAWKKPQVIFVNSMSDLFHEQVPFEFIQSVFEVMRNASWHVFQVLTKRSERLVDCAPHINWPANVWMGVSVENEGYTCRIGDLKRTPAAVKFISFEPLLAPVGELDLSGIDWAIVGGESGPHARPMKENWAIDIRDQCLHAHIPFFFKQWGGTRKKRTGRRLRGRLWDEMPDLAAAR